MLVALVVWSVSYARFRERSRRLRALIRLAEDLLGSAPAGAIAHPRSDQIGALERSLSAVAGQVRGALDRLKIEVAQREAILSSMGEGLLAVDKDLRVVFCNEAIARAVGVQLPIRDRLPLLELVRDSEILAIVDEAIKSGTKIKRSLKIAAAGSRSYEIHAAPFEGAAGRGAIAILHDITDLERLEQVRKDFIANVSHEMRTPLASIIACSDTLLEGALEDPASNRRFVEIIRSNGNRLNSISGDLLTLSDLESGIVPGPPERVSVREALETALRAVEREAAAGGIAVIPSAIEDLFAIGYRFRLEQAVLNLLANAVKFNRPGGEVRVSARATPSGEAQISISDTGIGIPSQDLPRIFERFYRVDAARSRQVGGTGLGLSIVRHVVEGMNGSVKVETQLGKGSTFTITLPAADR